MAIKAQIRWRRLAQLGALLSFGLGNVVAQPSFAQSLVVNGEEIANSQLYTAAKAERKIVLYSTAIEGPLKFTTDAFTADTGIKVELIRLTSERLYQRVLSEFSAGKLGADYIDLTDFTLLDDVVNKGVLQPYKVPNFDSIDSSIKDPQGRWYVLLRSLMVIGVNTAAIKDPLPNSWADLLDPKWKGRIGMASIQAGGTAFSAYVYLHDKFGADYWTKLSAQNPRIYPTSAPVMTDLLRGETVLTISAADAPISQHLAGAPVDVIIPVEGAPSFPVAGGITTASSHVNAAKVFMNWMATKHAAEILSHVNYYGINRDAPAPVANGVSFPDLAHVYNISLQDWEAKRTDYIRKWQEVFRSR